MAYTYSSDLTNPNYAICFRADLDGLQTKCDDGGPYTYPISYPAHAFNNDTDILLGNCYQERTKGFYGYAYSNAMVGQDFGPGNEKHIRKIRYYYFKNIDYVTIRASNNADFLQGQVTILANHPITSYLCESWNEILLPPSQPYRHWMVYRSGAGAYSIMGEIEMMEITGGSSGGSAFLL